METHAKGSGPVVSGKQQYVALNISETIGGYTIGNGGSARTRANIGELAAIVGCLFFGAMSFGPWLISDQTFGQQVLMFKISGTIMFFVFSALLYLIARRGLYMETQMDTKRQTLSLVRRNREGATTQLEKFGFSEIDSVYVKRSKSNLVDNQMFVRPRSGAPVLIASGPVRDLEPLLDRIQTDIRTQMASRPKMPARASSIAPPARARSAFSAG